MDRRRRRCRTVRLPLWGPPDPADGPVDNTAPRLRARRRAVPRRTRHRHVGRHGVNGNHRGRAVRARGRDERRPGPDGRVRRELHHRPLPAAAAARGRGRYRLPRAGRDSPPTRAARGAPPRPRHRDVARRLGRRVPRRHPARPTGVAAAPALHRGPAAPQRVLHRRPADPDGDRRLHRRHAAPGRRPLHGVLPPHAERVRRLRRRGLPPGVPAGRVPAAVRRHRERGGPADAVHGGDAARRPGDRPVQHAHRRRADPAGRGDGDTQQTGDRLRLSFLLYRGSAQDDPSPANAYRETHIWISVGGS